MPFLSLNQGDNLMHAFEIDVFLLLCPLKEEIFVDNTKDRESERKGKKEDFFHSKSLMLFKEISLLL